MTFYDLEVEGHPSYLVNGLPVHNCVQLPKTTQQAFLKVLEDTPKHAYFFLCSSDTSGLLPTFLSRCMVLRLGPLTDETMEGLLGFVCVQSGMSPGNTVVRAIVNRAGGNARVALTLLELVFAQPDDEAAMLEAVGHAHAVDDKAVAFLGRALLAGKDWRAVAGAVGAVKEGEVEGLRRQVLAYAAKVLASASGKSAVRAYLVIKAMEDPFAGGKAGLLAAAWDCCQDK